MRHHRGGNLCRGHSGPLIALWQWQYVGRWWTCWMLFYAGAAGASTAPCSTPLSKQAPAPHALWPQRHPCCISCLLSTDSLTCKPDRPAAGLPWAPSAACSRRMGPRTTKHDPHPTRPPDRPHSCPWLQAGPSSWPRRCGCPGACAARTASTRPGPTTWAPTRGPWTTCSTSPAGWLCAARCPCPLRRLCRASSPPAPSPPTTWRWVLWHKVLGLAGWHHTGLTCGLEA